MRYNEIDNELKSLAFDFFYYFSRFEFSLKENTYALPKGEKRRADVDWRTFREKHENTYAITAEANLLVGASPLLQIVKIDNSLDFIPDPPNDDFSELHKVIYCLHRVRNNLFHGGKHGANGEETKERNTYLLSYSIKVLHQLSKLDPNVEYDFYGIY